MKTLKTSIANITNKVLIREIGLMILFNMSYILYGQQVKNSEPYSFEAKQDTEYELTSFKCKSVEGKTYINWTAIESTNNSIYRLERSSDDKNYTTIYAILSSKSPNNIELLNSYVDEKPLDNTSFYRIKRMSNKDVITSAPVIVNGITIETDYSSAVLNIHDFAHTQTE